MIEFRVDISKEIKEGESKEISYYGGIFVSLWTELDFAGKNGGRGDQRSPRSGLDKLQPEMLSAN